VKIIGIPDRNFICTVLNVTLFWKILKEEVREGRMNRKWRNVSCAFRRTHYPLRHF